MTTDPLASRVAEVLCAAQHRFRTQRGPGITLTPRIPNGLIDELAAGLAPVLRDIVAAAVAARLDAPGTYDLDTVLEETWIKPTDLRPGKETA